MSLITNSSFHSDTLPGLVKKWAALTPVEYEPMYSQMMKTMTGDGAFEIHATTTGMGAAVQFTSGSALTLDSAAEKDKIRYEYLNYGLGFAITKNAMRDGNVFKDARKFTEMLVKGCRVTKELVASGVINFAGTSGYTQLGGDGVILASASHPTRGGLQSNILASGADLSEASLEAVRELVENAKDNRGLRQKLFIKDLIINPHLRPLAHRILQSDKQIDTLNNANFLKDSGTVKNIIVNPYLTSTSQWQVTTTAEDGLLFITRQDIEMDTDNEFMTKNGNYSVDMRITAGWDYHMGIFISL